MAQNLTSREKFYSINGLVCLAQGLEGNYTTIDLRNESFVTGKINHVDGFMNVDMSDVIYTDPMGGKYLFDQYFVQNRNIRYFHIPDQMPMIRTIETQLKKVIRNGKPETVKSQRTLKQKRTEDRQKETIKMIEEVKNNRLKQEEK